MATARPRHCSKILLLLANRSSPANSPVTEDIARRAGEYARTYRHSHSGIGVVDYLLAGTVAAVGADLMTTHVRHFPMFDDLRAPYEYGRQSSTGAGQPRDCGRCPARQDSL